ncbi:MAG: alpha/beta fold hydrolase [Alphaproteobacteria bacterium]|nr:alpha/beta fold hydrolase [Alphaproteobacteria bacterium]
MTPRTNSMPVLGPAGFFRLVWTEWGPAKAARTVMCVHGLTRNGRDFDALARALAAHDMRVVCPDMPGRGASDWLPKPDDYAYPIYMQTLAALYARLDVEKVDWVGTSMGGLIGMLTAAQRGHYIRKLVLNDVGPFIPAAALQRLGNYVGRDPRFEDFGQVEAYLRKVHAPFGKLTEAEWMHLAFHSAEESGDGNLRLRYDPAIGKPFQDKPADDLALWAFWDQLRVPVLAIRGADSDLLLRETLLRMAKKPNCEAVEIAACGHAPALMAADQIGTVLNFLSE